MPAYKEGSEGWKTVCSVDCCTEPFHAKGMCKFHYYRAYRDAKAKTYAKQGAKMRAWFESDPENRKKWSLAGRGRKHSPETIKKIKAGLAKRPRKLSTLMHYADSAFSHYVRKKNEVDGLIQCFTCPKRLPLVEMDCGHFVGRMHKSLRFSEENCEPQCRYCNRYLEGHKDAFALALVRKHGPEILEKLNLQKHQVTQLKQSDLEQITSDYRARLVKFGYPENWRSGSLAQGGSPA